MVLKPSVLVLSSTNTKPKSIIKLITKSALNDESTSRIEHLWKLETKYYISEINLIGLEKDFERNDEFNASVEGIIIHLDTNKETGLNDLKMWENIENQCEPDVKLLIANYCNDNTKIQHMEIIDWCIDKGFEFIELYPDADKIEPNEKNGVERIVEALESHTWSNLTLKSQNKLKKTSIEDDNSSDISDDFSDMFSQLQLMRESLCSLPTNQRKQCAEQMVTAFWRAIGGDEEEISDL